MLKVTLIGPVYPYRGGIAHHTTLLAQALQKKYTTQVISFLRQYPRWLYPGASDRDPSQQPIQVQAKYLLDPLNPITWIKTAHTIGQFQPDFIILPWWTTFWAPAFLSLSIWLKFKKIRLFYLIHNVIPHEARRIDPLLTRICFHYSSGFIVQSKREQAKLQQLAKTANIEYYPHPVYLPFGGQAINREEAREKLDLPPDRFTLLFFGIVRPYKGLNILLEALNQLSLKEVRPLLVVAGEIWGDPKVYFEMVERLGLKEQVRFHNRYIKNEELPVFFTAADLLVAPYLDGTQSGAVKMALGYHLPVVATDTIVDQSERDDNHSLIGCIPSGDPSALAKAILNHIQNRSAELAKQPGENSLPDWDGMVEKIGKLTNSNHREES